MLSLSFFDGRSPWFQGWAVVWDVNDIDHMSCQFMLMFMWKGRNWSFIQAMSILKGCRCHIWVRPKHRRSACRSDEIHLSFVKKAIRNGERRVRAPSQQKQLLSTASSHAQLTSQHFTLSHWVHIVYIAMQVVPCRQPYFTLVAKFGMFAMSRFRILVDNHAIKQVWAQTYLVCYHCAILQPAVAQMSTLGGGGV